MPDLAYRIVNVFTRETAWTGNPLCVFENGAALNPGTMQAIARQLNLSETAFVLPSSQANAKVRIFTPTHELPFAGHPVLGAASVIASLQGTAHQLTIETRAAIVPIRGEGRRWCFQARKPLWRLAPEPAELIARLLSIPAESIDATPMWVNTGQEQLLVSVKSADTVARAVPSADLAKTIRLGEHPGWIYVFCDDTVEQVVHARFFAPNRRFVIEDPATGSACANLGGWFCATRPGEDLQRVVRQGDAIKRPSTLYLEVRDGAVFVRGDVIEVGRGVMYV